VKTVLVVDDEADAVDFVRAVLENEETRVISARNGELGLRAAREQGPDLLVLDVQMPKKDGFTVLAELKQDPATSDIPVIMLTALGETSGVEFSKSDVGEFIGAEPDAYVEKPVAPAALKAAVARLLRR
jgi:CheY-like chemotaxis protein